MFWVFLLSVFGSIAIYKNRDRHRELIPYVVAVIAVSGDVLPPPDGGAQQSVLHVPHAPPADGQGLSPLLQNFYMAIHPPSLYTGLVAMTIPYAFGMAALDYRPPGRLVAARRASLDDARLAVRCRSG